MGIEVRPKMLDNVDSGRVRAFNCLSDSVFVRQRRICKVEFNIAVPCVIFRLLMGTGYIARERSELVVDMILGGYIAVLHDMFNHLFLDIRMGERTF